MSARLDVRWILFDAVGTLICADPPVAEVYHAAARRFGSRLSVDEIAKHLRAALADSQSRNNDQTSELHERDRWRLIVSGVIDDVDDAGGELFEYLWDHFAQPRYWRLYDDVAPALMELKECGRELGIASNFDGRLRKIAEGHPALSLCTELFLSSEIGFSKPAPQFFSTVVRQLDVPPEDILLVGDDEISDVEGALAAGWQAVHINRERAKRRPHEIDSLRDVSKRYRFTPHAF
jgi:putative hydrolase of the HAD superfamily